MNMPASDNILPHFRINADKKVKTMDRIVHKIGSIFKLNQMFKIFSFFSLNLNIYIKVLLKSESVPYTGQATRGAALSFNYNTISICCLFKKLSKPEMHVL